MRRPPEIRFIHLRRQTMMKKHLLALAALAAAGSACAQSQVTLFGVIDDSIAHYSTTSKSWAPGSSQTATQSQTALSSASTSRLGIRGTEDLGGGLAANFWLEAPLSTTNGTGGFANFGRRSTVSLTGPFGEIRLGRDYTTSFYNDGLFDPFGVSGVGTNLIALVNSNLAASRALATGGLLNGGLSAGTDSYLRTSNAVSYFLPPGLAGVYGQVQYALPGDVSSSVGPGSSISQRGRFVGGRLGWTNGKADVEMGYGDSTLTSTEQIKSMNLAGSYDFGVVKAFGEWSRVFDERSLTDRYDGLLAGVTVPVGPGLIRASLARVDYKNGNNLPNSGAMTNKWALGYMYDLSKRTSLYATVSRTNTCDGHNNPTVMGVTPLAISLPNILPQPAYYTTAGMEPSSSLGYEFGLRHSF
jgi:predicted porin